MRTSMLIARSPGYIVDLLQSVATSTTSTPETVGACLLDDSEVTSTVKLVVIMSTASAVAGSAAFMDLYDRHGVLSGGVPGVVAGSEINTTTGLPPAGGPAVDPVVFSAYEVDLTAAFAGFATPGVFEIRLWSEDNATVVAAAMAALVLG